MSYSGVGIALPMYIPPQRETGRIRPSVTWVDGKPERRVTWMTGTHGLGQARPAPRSGRSTGGGSSTKKPRLSPLHGMLGALGSYFIPPRRETGMAIRPSVTWVDGKPERRVTWMTGTHGLGAFGTALGPLQPIQHTSRTAATLSSGSVNLRERASAALAARVPCPTGWPADRDAWASFIHGTPPGTRDSRAFSIWCYRCFGRYPTPTEFRLYGQYASSGLSGLGLLFTTTTGEALGHDRGRHPSGAMVSVGAHWVKRAINAVAANLDQSHTRIHVNGPIAPATLTALRAAVRRALPPTVSEADLAVSNDPAGHRSTQRATISVTAETALAALRRVADPPRPARSTRRTTSTALVSSATSSPTASASTGKTPGAPDAPPTDTTATVGTLPDGTQVIEDEGDSTPDWLLPVAIGGGALLLGGAAILIVRRRRMAANKRKAAKRRRR